MGLTDYGRGVVGYQGCLGGGCSAVSPAVAGRGDSFFFSFSVRLELADGSRPLL